MKRWLLLGLALAGCGSRDPVAPAATTVRMDYQRPDFLAAPWPSESLRDDDGGISLAGFPDPTAAPIVERLVSLVESDAHGFATTAGIFFSLSGPLADEVIADYHAVDAPVFLVPIDGDAAGAPHPVEVRYVEDGGPFGAPHMLSILPLQGMPLRPGTLYAAVVTTGLSDRNGRALGRAAALDAIAGSTPPGMPAAALERYREALAALSDHDIAGIAVFETDDPTTALTHARDDALARPVPELATPFARTDLFDTFCVYEATLPMPIYQSGTPPFETEGGWVLDGSGVPILQGEELARIVVTVPRAPQPPEGFPVMLFSRTGGGGDRPLVDRGARAEPGGEAIAPGTGPALELARAGFAGVSVDGPHGGLRNVTDGDEQFLMFNVENPVALRDNVRQSALELAVQAQLLATLTVPAADCAEVGAAEARFDTAHLAIMGHSMGATIAPLAMSVAVDFGAMVLSGAGGSYIENVIYKQSPLPVRGFAELLLGVAGTWRLTEHDPVISLLQWALEPSDPPVYARAIRDVPRHVLMLQGIVDTYILPPIANATSLSLALDLAGEPLDAGHPELTMFSPLEPLLDLSGAAAIALPAEGNRPDATTAVVVQHAEDGVEDGHEVVFQTEAPKRQYRCMLAMFAAGATPAVTDGSDDVCP